MTGQMEGWDGHTFFALCSPLACARFTSPRIVAAIITTASRHALAINSDPKNTEGVCYLCGPDVREVLRDLCGVTGEPLICVPGAPPLRLFQYHLLDHVVSAPGVLTPDIVARRSHTRPIQATLNHRVFADRTLPRLARLCAFPRPH